jgi:hypothetical protein
MAHYVGRRLTAFAPLGQDLNADDERNQGNRRGSSKHHSVE